MLHERQHGGLELGRMWLLPKSHLLDRDRISWPARTNQHSIGVGLPGLLPEPSVRETGRGFTSD